MSMFYPFFFVFCFFVLKKTCEFVFKNMKSIIILMAVAALLSGCASGTRYASDEEEEAWEGCLSVPGLRGRVPRFARLRYTGFDEKGQSIDRSVSGFHARVVQHECDHLDGILYPMRVRDLRFFGFEDVLNTGVND